MYISKDETGYTDVDKPTSYKKEENLDEIEEGETVSNRKNKGKTNEFW